MIRSRFTTNAPTIVGQYWNGTPGDDLPSARGRIHVAEIPGLVNATVHAVMSGIKMDMQSFARQNHAWQNRTGQAEEGLTGYSGAYGGAVAKPDKVVHYAAIRHGVPYGIWLEVRWGGRFAIIQRTLEAFKDEVSRRLQDALNGLGS